MLFQPLFSLPLVQFIVVLILAFSFTHLVGFNKPYYKAIGALVQLVVDICSDKK